MKSFCQYMGCSYEFDCLIYHFNSDIRDFISHITYYSRTFFFAYTFKGQVHVFAGQVKIESHSSCKTSAILKYFCPQMSFTAGGMLALFVQETHKQVLGQTGMHYATFHQGLHCLLRQNRSSHK